MYDARQFHEVDPLNDPNSLGYSKLIKEKQIAKAKFATRFVGKKS